ncbi:ABC transporter ATP-binding protein [Tardisphaera miroshnichenkoae]
MENAVEVEELRHTYGGLDYALNGVSLVVKRGEIMGVLGKNGAGKTTLIKILTTLTRPTSGSVLVAGYDALSEPEKVRKKIGVVQQEPSMDYMTVEANLETYGILWGVPKALREKRKKWLIEAFGLEPMLKKRAFDLSGGQTRRLQIAREFMHDMDVLFLDEPTVGLDVFMRKSLLDLIRKMASDGLTVIFTTHNLEEADYLCDRIALIDSGKVVAVESARDFKEKFGNRKTVEIRVEEGKDAALSLARSVGDEVAAEEGGIVTVTSDRPAELVKELIEEASRRGLTIEWLSVRESTLEEAFFNAVSGGQR